LPGDKPQRHRGHKTNRRFQEPGRNLGVRRLYSWFSPDKQDLLWAMTSSKGGVRVPSGITVSLRGVVGGLQKVG
jgi:hypothetical protein